MKRISFDFNNMLAENIGQINGVSRSDLAAISDRARRAQAHLNRVISDPRNRLMLGLEWTKLPFQKKESVRAIQKMADDITRHYENVISLGIGGSYLGLKAAQDALCPPYYNDFDSAREAWPRIYFDGNNLDPDTLNALLKNLNPRKTFVVVISKSGETTETKAAFTVVEDWLKKGVGARYGRQVIAITDPESGTLRKRVMLEQSKDRLSFRSLPVMKGVGGRFSELNIGILHMALVGIDIGNVLKGAEAMARSLSSGDVYNNPALMYAAIHTILYRKKGKSIAIMMPFSETLKSTADWYVQLLAESLGKKYHRRIRIMPGGAEKWENDPGNTAFYGRTPISARGTNDLHSIQQNNIEGENNKAITFINALRFSSDIRIPASGDIVSGKRYSELISLACEACEWALTKESRPNCTITLPKIDAFYWGGLIYFFEMATALEGELADVNAFDQPGVEGYKNYMYYKLGKAGLAAHIAEDIMKSPLKKNPRFIL
jgi:glucose-6-phosphate isomerase